MEVFDAGHAAILQDFQGAVFAFGQLGTGLLGITSSKMPGPIDYTMLNVGGEDLSVVMQITGDTGSVPPHWVLYFGVDDVDAAATKVESPGGSVEVPSADIPEIGRFAGLKDPQGAMLFIFKSAN